MNVALKDHRYQERDVSLKEYITAEDDLIIPKCFLFKFDVAFEYRFANEFVRADKEMLSDDRDEYGCESTVLVYKELFKIWVFCY